MRAIFNSRDQRNRISSTFPQAISRTVGVNIFLDIKTTAWHKAHTYFILQREITVVLCLPSDACISSGKTSSSVFRRREMAQ